MKKKVLPGPRTQRLSRKAAKEGPEAHCTDAYAATQMSRVALLVRQLGVERASLLRGALRAQSRTPDHPRDEPGGAVIAAGVPNGTAQRLQAVQ